ncbi:MAG: hypothetical protein GY773_03630, partial [Actinomycetia bacterium]|nr:hypothetical protein [Actinomycetes bacterium]
MSRRLTIIGAIIRKDLTEFSRDRFYVLVTVLGLAGYVAIYWFLPASVDETIEAGFYFPGGAPVALAPAAAQGLELVRFERSAALPAAAEGDRAPAVSIGLDLPDGL